MGKEGHGGHERSAVVVDDILEENRRKVFRKKENAGILAGI